MIRAQDCPTQKEIPACQKSKPILPYPSNYKQVDDLEILAREIEEALADDRAVLLKKDPKKKGNS